jgi:hypothetical protein
MRRHRVAPLALGLLGALGGELRAGDPSGAQACVRIADNTARLACYDAVFAGAVHTGAAGTQAAHTGAMPAGAPAAGSAAAGKPAPEFGDRGQLRGEPQARKALPKRVNFKVEKAESLAGGLYRLTMDNGQIWVTKEADWVLDFKKGDEVTIQRMMLGGYRVSHAGQTRNVTVARIF